MAAYETDPSTLQSAHSLHNLPRQLLAGVAITASCLAANAPAVHADTLPAKSPAPTITGEPRFLGAAVSTRFLDQPGYIETFRDNFDSLTPENELKMVSTEPRPNLFTFDKADKLVDLALTEGKRVHGHALIYPAQDPYWVQRYAATCRDGINDKAESAELLNAMNRHITTVMEHFKDRIHEWDVVNEPSDVNNAWDKCVGPKYINEAFAVAHQVDPSAKLYISEFDVETATKYGQPNQRYQKFQSIVQQLIANHAPINGVGLQAHVTPSFSGHMKELGDTIDSFSQQGLTVELTEADVALPLGLSDPLDSKRQIATYAGMAKICGRRKACLGMTTWSVNDTTSWLAPGNPALIDANNTPKPSLQLVRKYLAAPNTSKK